MEAVHVRQSRPAHTKRCAQRKHGNRRPRQDAGRRLRQGLPRRELVVVLAGADCHGPDGARDNLLQRFRGRCGVGCALGLAGRLSLRVFRLSRLLGFSRCRAVAGKASEEDHLRSSASHPHWNARRRNGQHYFVRLRNDVARLHGPVPRADRRGHDLSHAAAGADKKRAPPCSCRHQGTSPVPHNSRAEPSGSAQSAGRHAGSVRRNSFPMRSRSIAKTSGAASSKRKPRAPVCRQAQTRATTNQAGMHRHGFEHDGGRGLHHIYRIDTDDGHTPRRHLSSPLVAAADRISVPAQAAAGFPAAAVAVVGAAAGNAASRFSCSMFGSCVAVRLSGFSTI